MVLDGKHRFVFQADPCDRLVIQIDFRNVRSGFIKSVLRRCEAMIVGGYRNRVRFEVLYGLIASAMAKFQLISFRPYRVGNDLMT